jgi:hypothetical protein
VLKIMERRTKLLGLDAPTATRQRIDAGVTYSVEWGQPADDDAI